MQYVATLFRGWEVVHIQYELEDAAVVMRRKRTWKGLETQRVELASLSGELRECGPGSRHLCTAQLCWLR